jgi:CRP-like cAMP-binding protein
VAGETKSIAAALPSPGIMQDLNQLLASHAFLKGLEPEHLKLLAAGARRVRFAPGGIIARESDEANRFYLILRGEVSLETKSPGPSSGGFKSVGPGEALGWSWLFPPFTWHFTCRAAQEVEALEWDTTQLRAVAEKHPRLGYELSRRLAQVLLTRLRATHDQLVGFYGQG